MRRESGGRLRPAEDHDPETVASVVDGEPELLCQSFAFGAGLFFPAFRHGIDMLQSQFELQCTGSRYGSLRLTPLA